MGPGRGLFEHVKRVRTAEALRYAGARMSTVGRRVVSSGRRVALGAPVRLDEDTRRIVSLDRRQGFGTMADVRREGAAARARVHWSEVA